MTATPARPNVGRRLFVAALFALIVVVLVPVVFVAVVTLAPNSLFGGHPYRLWVGFAPWWAAAALVVAAVGVVLLWERRTSARWAVTAVAVGALVIHGTTTGLLLRAGWSMGVTVNPFTTVDRRGPADGPDLALPYSEAEGEPLEMDIWQPLATDRPAPVLLYVHGGGWTSGDPSARATQMRWFADNGWLVLAPEYPLSGPGRHLWDSTVPQVVCAMVWAGDHAAGLGGDSSRLVLAGDSAGGNLAINAAYQAAAGTAVSACAGDPPEAGAVVALYPVVDPVGFHDLDGALAAEARRMTEDYTGGTPASVPERYQAVTSSTYISPAAPPTLLFVPGSDRLVPPDGAHRFAEEAAAAGVDLTVVTLPYLDHAFDVAPLPDTLYREVAHRWLRSRMG